MAWLEQNLKQRLTNPCLDFDVKFNITGFSDISFADALEQVCSELKQMGDLYLGLSGGMDSEFICRVLHKHGVKFEPIITLYNNKEESDFAVSLCEELGIEPIVHQISHKKIFESHKKYLVDILNGCGDYAILAILAAEYVSHNGGGTFISGEHFILDGEDIIKNMNYFTHLAEYDFYNYVLFENVKCIDPLLHYPEIPRHMLKCGYENQEYSWNQIRSEIYNIVPREKARARLDYAVETPRKCDPIGFIHFSQSQIKELFQL